MIDLDSIFRRAKKAGRAMAHISTEQKNSILESLATILEENTEKIVEENAKDLRLIEKENPLYDRLLLTVDRIASIAKDVRNTAKLHDFVGEVFPPQKTPSGLFVQKVRVPLGVIGMIYESRPNVTIDASILSFKSGNAVILKGGKEAEHSNTILSELFRSVLRSHDVSLEDAVILLQNVTREDTAQLIKAKGEIDLLIPRGGKGLINFVTEHARVPVIETGASAVHTFVDESADIDMAVDIIINEKTRRIAVCNTLDTVLIHEKIVDSLKKKLLPYLHRENITVHTDTESLDFFTEWLSRDITLTTVKNLDEAIDHISEYSLGHSESIVTNNQHNAERFLQEVDSACVYHNASTCFSDGGEFGLGAEIGISTQKLHARGPFALEGLTTYKWVIRGNGEIRN